MIDVDDALRVKDNFARFKDTPSILIKDSHVSFKPRVSVCIPTYKRVETLRETLDSIFAQEGFAEYDVIVSDDNPERGDETERFMKTVSDPRVKYYKSSKNLGPTDNWNRVIELTDAEYHVCIHDDDLLLPDFLSTLVPFLDRHKEIDIVYPEKLEWHQEQGLGKPAREGNGGVTYYYRMSLWDMFNHCLTPPTGYIGRKEKLVSLGGYDYRSWPSSDYYFGAKAFINSNVVRYCKPLWIFRWSVNVSFKKNTIISFMNFDIPLKQWAARHRLYCRICLYAEIMAYVRYQADSLLYAYPDTVKDEIPYWDKYRRSTLSNLLVGLYRAVWYKCDTLRYYLIRKKV